MGELEATSRERNPGLRVMMVRDALKCHQGPEISPPDQGLPGPGEVQARPALGSPGSPSSGGRATMGEMM